MVPTFLTLKPCTGRLLSCNEVSKHDATHWRQGFSMYQFIFYSHFSELAFFNAIISSTLTPPIPSTPPPHANRCSMMLHRKDHSSYQKSRNLLMVCHRASSPLSCLLSNSPDTSGDLCHIFTQQTDVSPNHSGQNG